MTKLTKESDMKYKTKEEAFLVKAISELTTDLEGVQDELDEFDAQIEVLDISTEIKAGYSLSNWIRAMRTLGRSACRIAKFKWKIGKEHLLHHW